MRFHHGWVRVSEWRDDAHRDSFGPLAAYRDADPVTDDTSAADSAEPAAEAGQDTEPAKPDNRSGRGSTKTTRNQAATTATDPKE